MLVHVVINRDVAAFQEVVAIKFHLLTRDTGTLLDSSSGILAVGELQCLHLVEVLAPGGNSSIQNLLDECDEVLAVGNEVGFALDSNHSCKAVNLLDEHTTVGCLTVRTLGSDSQTTLAEQVLSLVEIAFSLCESLFYISQTGTGHGAELLDIFNRYSHFLVFLSNVIKCRGR